jgi:hypothetical protein
MNDVRERESPPVGVANDQRPIASLTAPLRDKRRGRERPQRRSEALTATNWGAAGMDGLDDLGVSMPST